MTREEQFELLIRIRVLVKLAAHALRVAGHPMATLPLIAAPVSISAGCPCIHRAIAIVERSAPIYPGIGAGPMSRAGLAVAALRLGVQLVATIPPTEARVALDCLLETVLGAFGDVPGESLPTLDDERILAGSVV